MGTEEHEARCIHVCQLVSTEPIELPADGTMMRAVDGEQAEPRQIVEHDTE